MKQILEIFFFFTADLVSVQTLAFASTFFIDFGCLLFFMTVCLKDHEQQYVMEYDVRGHVVLGIVDGNLM